MFDRSAQYSFGVGGPRRKSRQRGLIHNELSWKVILGLFLATSMTCATSAQQSDATAIRKLSFLEGRWLCTIRSGTSDGLKQDVKYSFSPDKLWMTEVSQDSGTGGNDWATQMWGYDARTQRLVAYNFASNGVLTKSVDGWVDGRFQSRRDDNGAIVSVKAVGSSAVRWTVQRADGSLVVYEDCIRR
jgi:hypothetical protein